MKRKKRTEAAVQYCHSYFLYVGKKVGIQTPFDCVKVSTIFIADRDEDFVECRLLRIGTISIFNMMCSIFFMYNSIDQIMVIMRNIIFM